MKNLDTTSKHRNPHPTDVVDCIPSNADGIPYSFGQQLDVLLKVKHFRNTKLASRAGISPNLVAQYRRGKASCSPDRANRLAGILGCTEAQRIALCRAAALTTKDPVGQCIHALLLEHGIQQDSIDSVAPSATCNQISIATRDGRTVKLTVSVESL